MAKPMRIKYKRSDYKGLRKKLQNFDTSLYSRVCDLWMESAQYAIQSVILTQVIHVDTGMSAATILPLAKKARIDMEIRQIIKAQRNPARAKTDYTRVGITRMDGVYDTSGWRNMKVGEQAARKASKLLFGSEKRPWMVFEFDITVYQYALHEKEWKSLTILFKSFNDYLKRNMEKALDRKGLLKIMKPISERGYKSI